MSVVRSLLGFGSRQPERGQLQKIETPPVVSPQVDAGNGHADQRSLPTLQQWSSVLDLRDLGWQPTTAGPKVTPETALSVPVVWSAVRKIAQPLSTCPLLLMEPDGDDGVREAKEDDTYWIIKEQPNGENTPMELIETWVMTAALRGDSVLHKKTTTRNRLLECNFIHPDRIRFRRRRGELVYEIADDYDNYGGIGQYKAYFGDEVCHLRGTSPDAVVGYSPIQLFIQQISQMLAHYQYNASLLRNGGATKGIITTEPGGPQLTDEQLEDYRERWKEAAAGAANAGKVAFLPGGFKFQSTALSPTDMALIAQYGLTIRDASLIWDIPLHMLAEQEHATFSNIEQQSREYIRDVMRIWAVRVQQVANRDLLSWSQRQRGMFFRFDLDAILEGDSETQSNVIKNYIGCGVLSVNEGRKIIGRNPVEGGDKHTTQMQNVDIGANPMDAQVQQGGNNDGKQKKDQNSKKKRTELPAEVSAALIGLTVDALEKIHRRQAATLQNAAQRSQTLNDFSRSLETFVRDHRRFAADFLASPLKRTAQALGVDAVTVIGQAADEIVAEIQTAFASCRTIEDVRTKAQQIAPASEAIAERLFAALQSEDKTDEN